MQPVSINTLGTLIDHGYRLSAHCNAEGCYHADDLDLHMLAERLGRDFRTVGDPNPLAAKLRCRKCGGKDLGLIVAPPSVPVPNVYWKSD